MNWQQITTMGDLWLERFTEQGAVLKYGENVLVTGLTCRGFEAAIYKFIKDEEEMGVSYTECRINLRTACDHSFDDGDDAIKWCFDNLNA